MEGRNHNKYRNQKGVIAWTKSITRSIRLEGCPVPTFIRYSPWKATQRPMEVSTKQLPGAASVVVKVSGLEEEGMPLNNEITSSAILRTSPAGNARTTVVEVVVVDEEEGKAAETLGSVIITVRVVLSFTLMASEKRL